MQKQEERPMRNSRRATLALILICHRRNRRPTNSLVRTVGSMWEKRRRGFRVGMVVGGEERRGYHRVPYGPPRNREETRPKCASTAPVAARPSAILYGSASLKM